MRIDTNYDIGESVYLKTDSDQRQRMIVQITIFSGGCQYYLSCGTENSWHYDIEFTKEKDILKTVE